ncbi:hypothetical protein V3C99_019076 [Haemonchus contortus]|uniref:Alpha-carbonic anhydrase domain-containing protein n=1 Tax=Haemonchus contortus TaxID=6289 RepID=A0A7I4Z0A6_HAECO|nr:Carbonic anhydrase domain containing protein [Haemonchus contortus]
MYRALFSSLGERQSPINIDPETVICDSDMCQPSSMKLTYHEGDCEVIVAEPTTWRIKTGDNCKSSLTASHLPAEFRLLQIHGHWGSKTDCGTEHSIDYHKYAAEVHFVFWNTTYDAEEALSRPDGLTVVAVFLKVGKHNDDYAHITGAIRKVVRSQEPLAMPETFDLAKLIPIGSDYIYYKGSLTTPPFNESVLWTIMLTPVEVSHKQLRQFHRIGVKENFRDIQPLNGRKIYSSCQLSKVEKVEQEANNDETVEQANNDETVDEDSPENTP